MHSPTHTQHGAALFVALIFLVIITLLSITAMNTSTLELLMATNEQSRRVAIDATESASDVVINSNLIKIGSDGDITCFGFGSTPTATLSGGACTDTESITAANGAGSDNFVQVTMVGTGACPPSVASSARGASSLRTSGAGGSGGGGCAYYTLESQYDATDKKGGYAEIQEGFVRLAF